MNYILFVFDANCLFIFFFADDVNHTFGPLDGSIYATIAKKPEQLSPGAVSSPLTVSMDSGISSAGQ